MVLLGFGQQPLWKPVVTVSKRRDESLCAGGPPYRRVEDAAAATRNWLNTGIRWKLQMSV